MDTCGVVNSMPRLNNRLDYLSKEWRKWPGCWISNRLVAADSGTRVHIGSAVVYSRLADVVICNGQYFRAVLVAI